jgi:hypothetical protein
MRSATRNMAKIAHGCRCGPVCVSPVDTHGARHPLGHLLGRKATAPTNDRASQLCVRVKFPPLRRSGRESACISIFPEVINLTERKAGKTHARAPRYTQSP